MSCIAGEFRVDGSEADRYLVEPMLAPMRPRAPDGADLVCAGPVALAQAFLRTGSSGAEAPHRLTLEGEVWIVADARIDGRNELVTKLRSAGRDATRDAPHAELILHAWHAFGDKFLNHLIGDFAFALWDPRAGRLVCARDTFGVRPFYYAESEGRLTFASDISALLMDPDLSRELDDEAIADFHLIGTPARADQTIYRHIRCLPPGGRLDVDAAAPRIRVTAHTQLTPQLPIRFAHHAEYAECFLDLFRRAVADRLPHGGLALQLSGGMDSTSIAAIAASMPLPGLQVTALHISARSLEAGDDEERFARIVADDLRIPMSTLDLGAYRPFEPVADPQLRTAFPSGSPLLAAHRDMVASAMRSGARVMFSGYGGDAAMSADMAFYVNLLRRRRWREFAGEAADYLRARGTFRGMGLRALVSPRRPPPWKPAMPDWFEPGYAQRIGLAERWQAWWARHEQADSALAQLTIPWHQRTFEGNEMLALPLVFRYPFLDLRVVRFLMSIPNFMLSDKKVLRDAMRGLLPEEVRSRSKTAAAGDTVRSLVTSAKFEPADLVRTDAPGVVPERFAAAWNQYRNGHGKESTWASALVFHPLALGVWLRQQQEQGE